MKQNYAIAMNGFYLTDHGANSFAWSSDPANARRFGGQWQAKAFADERVSGNVTIVSIKEPRRHVPPSLAAE
jgi:hypothetical protein